AGPRRQQCSRSATEGPSTVKEVRAMRTGLSQLVEAELGASLLSAPLYTGGTLVAGLDDGTVRALDPSTGGALWSYQTGGRVAGSPLAVQCGKDPGPINHVIVAGSDDGHVYGIGGASGQQVWSFEAGAPVSTAPIDPTAVED